MILFLLWYFVWQWENLYRGKKILARVEGCHFQKLMYLGETDQYGNIYYDGANRILFHARGRWHCYKFIDNQAMLLHLRACYQFSPFAWKKIYVTWCDMCGARDLNEAVRLAKRHCDTTPRHKISSNGEKYDFIPLAQDICNAFLWLRNFLIHGINKWVTYIP